MNCQKVTLVWNHKWVEHSISWLQQHKGFIVSWKLCLNLCFLKWLRASLSLVISSTPLGLWQSKKELGEGSYETKYFFLEDWNTVRVSTNRFLDIPLNNRWKKEFLKKLCFVLIRGILPTVLVTYGVLLTGMKLKRYFGCSFLKTL